MKKIIFLLFITTGLYADGFYSAGSFGYDWMSDIYKTSMIVGYEYNGFSFEAEQDTYMYKSDLHMFSPYEQEYFARVKYEYKFIFVQWEHLCVHGIDNYFPLTDGHDRFTIGFDTRNNDKNKDP